MSGYQAAALEFLSTPSARRATSPGDSFFARPRNFYPRPPRGGRRASSMVWRRSSSFLSTPSARRATPSRRTPDRTRSISIHALREEGDHYVVYIVSRTKRFLSTPSARRATRWPHSSDPDPLHFYPRPPRGGRLIKLREAIPAIVISIHALREEGDPKAGNFLPVYDISIHALREEGDSQTRKEAAAYDISIHALREEGDDTGARVHFSAE